MAILDIPGYQIEKLIADGGMASVYLARQESLGRLVALKLLRKFDNKSQAERFFNEGRIIASLEHHNIITIFDLGVVDERHYLAMEYLPGGDLKNRIEAGMDASKVLEIVEILASCLGFVHQNGIIHRDIKPENILFRQDGTVVLTDFGVAKQMEANNTLTMNGITLGSPYYLSPEQAQSKPLDGRADIYSLGIVCYEMLTGMKPFQGESPLETILAHLTSEPLPLPPQVSHCQTLLSRMIAKNPEDRFSSASELVDFVRQLRASRSNEKSRKTVNPQNKTTKRHAITTKPVEKKGVGHNISLEPGAFRSQWLGIIAGLIVIGPLTVWLLQHFFSAPASEQILEVHSHPQSPKIDLQNKSIEPLSEASQNDSAEASASPEKVQPTPNVNDALRRANAILKDKRLTIPKLKEAYDLYQLAINTHTRKSEALGKVNIIANRFVAIKSDIGRSLVLAESAMKSNRLIEPAQNNAADYYRHILELDPEQPEAQQGADKLAGLLADRVEGLLQKSESAEAERVLRIGLSLQAEHPRLLAMASQIKGFGEEVTESEP